MITFKKRIQCGDRKEYYETHWRLINAIFRLDLTDREISILSTFMSIRADENTFDSTTRRLALSELGLSTSLISNYIKRLTKKGVLKVELDETGVRRTRLVETFIPSEGKQDYYLRINEGAN